MNRFEINFENTHILFFFSFEGIRINAIRLKHILYTEMEIPREITMAKTNKFPSNYSFHSNLSPGSSDKYISELHVPTKTAHKL